MAEFLTDAEREELENTIRWHMNVHKQEEGDLYKLLCVQNAILKAERIVARHRAEAAAQALRDARDELPALRDMPTRWGPVERVKAWLDERADLITKED